MKDRRDGQRKRRFAIAAATAFFLLLPLPDGAATEPNEENVQRIVDELDRLPEWPLAMSFGKPDERRKQALEAAKSAEAIETSMKAIDQFDTPSIREAVRRVSQDPVFDEARLLWLNRYLFDTPDYVARASPHFSKLTRCAGFPHDVDRDAAADPQYEFSTRWPWKRDAVGELKFDVAKRLIVGAGKPYEGLELFDYYASAFGRRSKDDLTR